MSRSRMISRWPTASSPRAVRISVALPDPLAEATGLQIGIQQPTLRGSVVQRDELRSAGLVPQLLQPAVAHDCEHPGLHVAVASESVAVKGGLHVGFLDEIFRFGGVAGSTPCRSRTAHRGSPASLPERRCRSVRQGPLIPSRMTCGPVARARDSRRLAAAAAERAESAVLNAADNLVATLHRHQGTKRRKRSPARRVGRAR